MLLIGRIIQAIVTPRGVLIPDEMELDDEDCWNDQEIQTEGTALAKLVAHCRTVVATKSLKVATGLVGETDDILGSTLLAGVGRAVIPFSRALSLMLRACSAAIRERQQKSGVEASEPTAAEKVLESVLSGPDTMGYEDGFQILKALQGPNPSALIDVSGEWWFLINRWLVSAIGLEVHHGSTGRSIIPDIMPFFPDQKESSRTSGVSSTMAQSSAMHAETEETHGEAATSPVSIGDQSNDTGMEVDAPAAESRNHSLGETGNSLFDQDLYDDDEELVDEMEVDDMEVDVDDEEEAEEMIGFAEQILGVGINFIANQEGNDDPGESSEESYSDGDDRESDREFAHVSQCPIIPFQPSLFAVEGIGPGRKGSMFEFSTASAVMADMSHLGLIHRKDIPTFSLIRLPKSFVELYNIVNKIKGRDEASAMDDGGDDSGSAETAICLLTGAVMRSGSSRRAFARAARPPGACTMHARRNGSGIGLFFLVQKCTVLLMHNNKSAYSPSLYVDEHGEEDPGLRRGRPLFLNEARYRSLELLWRQQLIPREVAQIRSTSDRVIRDNWY
jgi:hypothetical protein